MNDKSALLNQLKIDREPERDRGDGGGPGKWIAIGLLVLLLIGAAIWWFSKPSGLRVQAAVAQNAGATASGPASLLDASGYVVARRSATVSAKITGKVTEVLIEEGQSVREGEIVGRLDDTNIRAQFNQAQAQLGFAKASHSQVKVQLANAERDLKRKQQLRAQNYVSQAEIDNAQTTLDDLKAQLETAARNVDVSRQGLDVAQKNLDDTVVRAPFSGVVTVKAAQTGEIVSPLSAGGGFTRTGIGTIVDMDSLEIEVDVNESFINRVHPDQPASAKLNAYPDWEIPSKVIAIIPTADRAKATVKVRVGFLQRDARILPDMGVRVSFLSEAPKPGAEQQKPGVQVPSRAVQAQGAQGVVFVIRDEKLERRAVKLGARSGDNQIVLSGLAAGDRVAIGDNSRFADGLAVVVEP
ncbi:efflux RND transporter periplasmic adaptor subunit [Hydrocarboniphaga sp.]|uniref:efflux RND transporter periplasmic adaptor subunit n=1 Tax=Hydrocarboniphaga sp. TaxID=2033016 RepID=UPI002ABC9279|nr:efflux RND transporter periplasmic adaptor subunit [Hydrocarboniphaga sp.]MDZ4080773.1 efflux RND transporter periplasmic adaptor subunit [Hydrocarboniphaga sp.]